MDQQALRALAAAALDQSRCHRLYRVAVSGCLTIMLAWPAHMATAGTPMPIAAARSWIYQLQGDTEQVARSSADVAVVDFDHVRTRAALDPIKRKPDRSSRVVLGYLSIGEAEDSRPYWKVCCTGLLKPSWLTDRTQGWPGNFAVRYWEADWQSLVQSRVRQLIDAGFDGVYLDRADVWETMQAERASARTDMIVFVRALSAMARAAKPGFSIIVQNAEELLSDQSYLAAIDGIAKEDLVHGVNHDGQRNPPGMIADSVRQLRRARAQGKPVFVVEYLPRGPVADSVRAEIVSYGFIPLTANRDLAGD